VVGREDGRDWAYNRTDALVQFLVCGGVDGFFEGGASFSTEVGVGGNAGVFVQEMVVVGRCFSDWTDKAWCIQVEVWVGGRKNGVGCADDGADLLCGGCHDVVVTSESVAR
jgi:hypothetical protein